MSERELNEFFAESDKREREKAKNLPTLGAKWKEGFGFTLFFLFAVYVFNAAMKRIDHDVPDQFQLIAWALVVLIICPFLFYRLLRLFRPTSAEDRRDKPFNSA